MELTCDFHESRDVKFPAIEGVHRWMKRDFATPGVRARWEDQGRETLTYNFGVIVDSGVIVNSTVSAITEASE
jgi:hypothetical protein